MKEISVHINGESKTIPANITIFELLSEMELDLDNIAVEHNGTIIHRHEYNTKNVYASDKMEIIEFVGGG